LYIFFRILIKMTSVVKNYAQIDNRLENVTLTGFISNNGLIAGLVTLQRPAYAAIDLTKAKNFSIDTRVLTLRTDASADFLLRVYISSSKPPLSYQNFEFDIFVTPPTGERRLFIEIYADKANAENAQLMNGGSVQLYGITNKIPSGNDDYSEQTGILTFKVLNNSIILKGISPFYTN